MDIKVINSKEDQAIISIIGDLTIYHVKKSNEIILKNLEKYNTIEIDLSGVEKFDSAGFQHLLFIKKEAKRRDKNIQLINHSENVNRVVQIYSSSHE